MIENAHPKMGYPFVPEDFARCQAEWGANCGPAALAFAFQISLDSVRRHIPGFEAKRYTNPSMMLAAVHSLCRVVFLEASIRESPPGLDRAEIFTDHVSLVRVQFTGPWTRPGTNARWRYGHTHWVTTWRDEGARRVFDGNFGIRDFDWWASEGMRALTEGKARSDGGWYPTHVYSIERFAFREGAI